MTLLRVLQLSSAALPIGAFSYSHGLEAAIDAGWVGDVQALVEWQDALLTGPLGCVDVPIFARCHAAFRGGGDAEPWAFELRALRETRELRDEDHVVGRAFAKLLSDLSVEGAQRWRRHPAASHLVLFALAASHFGVRVEDALEGYLFSFLENQLACAIKLSLVGQTDAQRTLLRLADRIPSVVRSGAVLPDAEIGCFTHALSIASSHHETQYSRLFRS